MSNLTITNLKDLKDLNPIVELGHFDNGVPFVARVKKPNLLALVAHGKIPNPLMSAAMSLFNGNEKEIDKLTKDPKSLANLYGLMEVLAKECLIEPSFDDLQEAGIELSQDQLLSVVMFAQGGINALEDFRQKSRDNQTTEY